MLRLVCKMACAIGLALGAAGASAQQYPNRPIHFIQGFAPGGNADVITRVLGLGGSSSLTIRRTSAYAASFSRLWVNGVLPVRSS